MLVMELARLGPLNKYLRSHSSTVSIATVTLYMYQVAEVSECKIVRVSDGELFTLNREI